MPDTNPQETLDTSASEFRLNRLESAWRGGEPTPRWQEHLPADDEPCIPSLIFNLLQMEIECRIKAGLPALLVERYFEHPRLQKEDARLNDEQQQELIRWEYQLRWENGQQARRAEYESAFPEHAEAVREMKPQSRCPLCRKLFVLDETYQTRYCPTCESASPSIHAGTHPEFDPRGYQLIEQLGKGGMGEVYRCGDPALGRDLAIKVMKAEYLGHAEAERRFLREARVTGSLQHPGIVPVHNLGRLADGRLHYTMRLVRGDTFADILEKEAGKPERLPDLLSIFEKICQAVAYAHSKRVIHRDLKPRNVMVGKFGEVQVMDWGLAKLLTPDSTPDDPEEMTDTTGTRIFTESADTPMDLSRAGVRLGTFPYMPSEQARGKWNLVDERADVFALGSILCEILTGQPAYIGTSFNELCDRAERGDVAEALQRLQHCGADAALTALCRECLSPQREDRPRDADVVAKRVAEYQAEVQERLRQSQIERAQAQLRAREGRKQRRLLIALVLALLTGSALSTWQAIRATAERDDKDIALGKAEAATEAERQAKDSDQARLAELAKSNEVLGSIFRDLDPSAEEKGGPSLREQLSQHLERSAKQLDQGAIGDAVTVASLQGTLGRSLTSLGKAELAIELLSKAELTLKANLGPDHPHTLTSRHNLAAAYQAAGRTADAIRLYEQTLKQREATLGPEHSDTLISLNNLASAYWYSGRIAEAIRLHEQNLKQLEAKFGADHPETLTSRNNLALAYTSSGRTSEAIRLHEQNLKQREAKLGPDHPGTLASRNNLASAYWSSGRIAEAIRLYEQNVKHTEAKLGPEHPHTLRSHNNLASAYQAAGRTSEAIHLWERNLKQSEAKLGADHPDTLVYRNGLAGAYRDTGRTADAIRLYEQTLKQSEAKLGADYPDTLITRLNLGNAYMRAGRNSEAIHLHEQNFKQSEAKLGPDHPITLSSMYHLGATNRDAGRFKEAIPLLEEALKRGRKRSDGLPAEIASLPAFLGETYERTGQFAKAESLCRDSLEQAQRKLGSEDLGTAGQMASLGHNLLRQHKYTDAEPLLRDCLKIRAAKQPDTWNTFNTRSLLGTALLGQKKYTDAEPLLLQGYEGMKAREANIPPEGKERLTEALERLVQLYKATDQTEKAAQWRKKLQETKAAQNKPKPRARFSLEP